MLLCISLSAISLRKSMTPIILIPAKGEFLGKTGLFNLGMTTSQEEKLLIKIS